MSPRTKPKNKWLNQQISKRYTLRDRQRVKDHSDRRNSQSKNKNRSNKSLKTSSNRFMLNNKLCPNEHAEHIHYSIKEMEFLQLAENIHYKWCSGISDDDLHCILSEQMKYLIYTDFTPCKLPSWHRNVPSERQWIERIQAILYKELHKRELDAPPLLFYPLMKSLRKVFLQRVSNMNFAEIQINASNEMQNDLNQIVAENSVSRRCIIECVINFSSVGKDIADVIADFLSDQYPFLCEPPPNPYYYENSALFSHFGLLNERRNNILSCRAYLRRRREIQIVKRLKKINSTEIYTTTPGFTSYVHCQDLVDILGTGDFTKNERLKLFHCSKGKAYEWRFPLEMQEEISTTKNKMVGSIQHNDGEMSYFYCGIFSGYRSRRAPANICLSKSWTDLWEFMDNEAIKIDCYSGLYFANTDAM